MQSHRKFIPLALGVSLLCAESLLATPVGAASDSLSIRVRTPGVGASTQPVALPSLGFDITRMLLALAIVIGLIYASRWILKRFYGGAVSPAGNRVVQVLSRTVLAPKQQVMLLQVGKRVIVVGESNGAMATLAQIDDPDEIAQLVGRLQEEHSTRAGAFGSLFGRAQTRMAEDESAPPLGVATDTSTPTVEETKSELSGLLEKVRSIRGQIGRDS